MTDHSESGATGKYHLPGDELTVPTKGEPCFPMRHTDWARLRKWVAALADPFSHSQGLAWTCVGIAVGAFLAFLPWQAANGQLPTRSRLDYAWVGPTMLVIGGAAVILAIYAFWVGRKWKKLVKRDVTHVLEDMDAIYDRWKNIPALEQGQVPAETAQ